MLDLPGFRQAPFVLCLPTLLPDQSIIRVGSLLVILPLAVQAVQAVLLPLVTAQLVLAGLKVVLEGLAWAALVVGLVLRFVIRLLASLSN